MGYLILNQPITVLDGGQTRNYRIGVNKDVTQEEAEHWYVRAAGGQYVENLEDAHKQAPGARQEAVAMRAQWETSQKAAIIAGIQAESLRQDLVKVEKEFGIDTRAADKTFRESMKQEEARLKDLQDTAEAANAEQMVQNENGSLTPAQAEVVAAGSANVANVEMDGPARAAAEKAVASNPTAPGVGGDAAPTEAPKGADIPKPTDEEVSAAGSEENANRAEAGIKPEDPVDAKPKTTVPEKAPTTLKK